MNPHQPARAPGLSDEEILHLWVSVCRENISAWGKSASIPSIPRLRAFLTKAALASVKVQGKGMKQIGWYNTKYETFFALGVYAATPRNDALLASGEVIRVYAEQPAELTDSQGEQSPPVASVPMPGKHNVGGLTLLTDTRGSGNSMEWVEYEVYTICRDDNGAIVAWVKNREDAPVVAAALSPNSAVSRGDAKCDCHTCRPITFEDSRMILCPTCGNKRCPKANFHGNACTNSNEPGQSGSAY